MSSNVGLPMSRTFINHGVNTHAQSKDICKTMMFTQHQYKNTVRSQLSYTVPKSQLEIQSHCQHIWPGSEDHFRFLRNSTIVPSVLGDSGGVVNSLDFCPASLKSLDCFYFRCVLSSQWKAVTVNLRILHCQL